MTKNPFNNIKKGEPLKLPDGTIVLPEADEDGSKVVSVEEQHAQRELEDIVERPFDENAETVKRTLADVTDEPKRFNVTMVVLAYTVWGLEPFAIASLLDTSVENVQTIVESELFTQLRTDLVDAIRYAETSSIHGYLSQQAMLAARTISAAMMSKSADQRLAAAKDVLDRTGFRPADRVEHVHKFDDELRIVRMQEKQINEVSFDADDL